MAWWNVARGAATPDPLLSAIVLNRVLGQGFRRRAPDARLMPAYQLRTRPVSTWMKSERS